MVCFCKLGELKLNDAGGKSIISTISSGRVTQSIILVAKIKYDKEILKNPISTTNRKEGVAKREKF